MLGRVADNLRKLPMVLGDVGPQLDRCFGELQRLIRVAVDDADASQRGGGFDVGGIGLDARLEQRTRPAASFAPRA
jgi:hypothetical protein